MLDEQGVDGDPVPRVDPFSQRSLGLFGRPGPHDAEPVRDPMDVGVHRDRRDPVAEDEDAVRGLRPDAGERHERFKVAGDHSAEPLQDLGRHPAEDPGLHPVEPRRPDQWFDLGRGGAGERRRVREPLEEAGACDVGVRVAGPLREDRADEDLERVLCVVAQVRSPPVPRAVERAQPVEEPFPVEPGGRTVQGAHGGPLRAFAEPPVRTAVDTPGSERSGSSPSSAPRNSSPTR